MPPASVATTVESAIAATGGVIVDDRRVPLFKPVSRLRETDNSAWWHMKVVDEELLAQGAPQEIILQALAISEAVPAAVIGRALEACLVDHPRLQMCHSVALPGALLREVQPAEPSSLLPPLHCLPLCDDARCLLLVKEHSDGTPMLQWRQARGSKVKLGDVLDLLDTLGDALATLHRRGHAHGAMTPDLVVMQERALPQVPGTPLETVWVPKIVDIGLLRQVVPPGDWPTGPVALWCAPEVFEPEAMTDWRRVDQLALAALLYALWTNNIPFEQIPPGTPAREARALRVRQIEALPPPRGSQLARALGVTPAMSSACLRAMSPEPAERFPTLDAFSAALRKAAREALRGRGGDGDLTQVEPSDTSPGTSSAPKFRSLTTSPPAYPTPPPAKAPAPDEPPPVAGRLERPAPAVRPTAEGLDPEVAAAAALFTPAPEAADRIGPDEATIGVQGLPSRPLIKEPARDARAAARARRAPAEEEGRTLPTGTPAPRREATPAPDLLLPAPPSPWSLNRLAAVLLVLWLATVAVLFLREPAGDDGDGLPAAAPRTLPAPRPRAPAAVPATGRESPAAVPAAAPGAPTDGEDAKP